jgi:hypothetical protein
MRSVEHAADRFGEDWVIDIGHTCIDSPGVAKESRNSPNPFDSSLARIEST